MKKVGICFHPQWPAAQALAQEVKGALAPYVSEVWLTSAWDEGEARLNLEGTDLLICVGGDGTMLDHTTVVWTNELGKGNSHTLDDIPFVIVGGGLGFRTGRSLKYGKVPHNRLLMAFAHAFGHNVDTFGKPELCAGGVLPNLV